MAQRLKRLPARRETRIQSLGREDPLEKEMATHSSILAWKIPWTEEPGRLHSTGSQRVGHDWVTSLTHSLFKGRGLGRERKLDWNFSWELPIMYFLNLRLWRLDSSHLMPHWWLSLFPLLFAKMSTSMRWLKCSHLSMQLYGWTLIFLWFVLLYKQ